MPKNKPVYFVERLISLKMLILSLKGSYSTMDADTKRIAMQRIQTLFRLANETFHEDPSLAQHYANTARKIAMAAKIRLPPQYRRQICRHCKSFILPSVNSRVRIKQQREPHIAITCLKCGKQTRILLRKKGGKAKK
jgi:ribonuclease P protein subunit RPR2